MENYRYMKYDVSKNADVEGFNSFLVDQIDVMLFTSQYSLNYVLLFALNMREFRVLVKIFIR
jgi:hypothetical protein